MTDFDAAPQDHFDPDDPTLFVKPPAWPKVVGIVSLVFAGLGLTCMGCIGVMMFVFVPMGEQQMGPMPAVMKPGPLNYALMGVGLAMTFVLVGAGITTISRKPMGRVLHLIWAALSVPLAIVNMVLQYNQQTAIAQWAADNPDSQWAQQQQNPIIGIVLGVLIGLAWPVFCLVWFGLMKTKHSDMTGAHDPVDG